MNPLQNRIDFCVIISVDGANPNGDPATMSWYPRVLYDGHGEISDVCLKRKIRKRPGKPGRQDKEEKNESKENWLRRCQTDRWNASIQRLS